MPGLGGVAEWQVSNSSVEEQPTQNDPFLL